jgi:hypothetical protein
LELEIVWSRTVYRSQQVPKEDKKWWLACIDCSSRCLQVTEINNKRNRARHHVA